MKRICKCCGKEFELTAGEIQFYELKNLSLPKRCKECRALHKKNVEGHRREEQPYKDRNIFKRSIIKSGKQKNNIWVVAVAVVMLAVIGFFDLQQAHNDYYDINSVNNIYNTVQSENAYTFRNEQYLIEHFQKHGADFDYSTKEEYEAGANRVITSSDALHKTEKEDGDDVYYLENSNEFVIVSTDGYIRTYFKPDSGIEYYDKQ